MSTTIIPDPQQAELLEGFPGSRFFIEKAEAVTDYGSTYPVLRAMLECGHFSDWTHAASSQWDFPRETQACSECDRGVLFDPIVIESLEAC